MSLEIKHVTNEIAIKNLDAVDWKNALPVEVSKYWDGKDAPAARRMSVRMMWSATALYAFFEAVQSEQLVVAEKPELTKKAMNLWDRDVVEIFVAPDKNEPRKYFEFEAAPNGEWLDVALDSTSGTRISDWEYSSGMESAAKIVDGGIVVAIKVPWKAFGKTPKAGDVWLGNLLRCIGKDPDRGYLAWSPTMTEQPNFHVPERFGEFHFIK